MKANAEPPGPPGWLLVCLLAAALPASLLAQGGKADYQRALSLDHRTRETVYRDRVRAHWLPSGTSFWYRVKTGPGREEVVLVDAVTGSREVETPAARQAAATRKPLRSNPDLARASRRTGAPVPLAFANRSGQDVGLVWLDSAGKPHSYGRLPPGETRTVSTFSGHVWLATGSQGKELGLVEAADEPGIFVVDGSPAGSPSRKSPPDGLSPDGTWLAFIRANNLWLRNSASGAEAALTQDGTDAQPLRPPLLWSPDSSKLTAIQEQRAQEHKIHLIESSPQDQLQPKLHSLDYLKPGDRIAHPHPRLFEVASRREIAIREALFANPWSITHFHWLPDSSGFAFLYNQRGHQVLRVVAVNAATGAARALVEETSRTFIDYSQKTFLHWLDRTGELLWMSERDGWNHLWLIDARSGSVKNPVTHGDWVLREVLRVDEERRQVWFLACGVRPAQDPYYQHLCRANFDGTGFAILTAGDGTHRVEFSPDRRWFIDAWSRVDQPPVTELRRSQDGQLVCVLEQADVSRLLATGWTVPERFTAKGRDGKTDIFGILVRPSNFDPARSYPVIEQVYAGPQSAFVAKAWDRLAKQHALAELGFVVVQSDGMGTNWRSRAFHEVCWKNLRDAGFPDRIAWLRAAASARPWMDLTRVGIYGGSTGGMNALSGLLHFGDFYQVGVADCGCHDNRMDKIWWNEAWMGWPVGPEYAANSNVTHAAKLQGKLLLIVGELDKNVDPASTLQVVNALERADKDFDLLIMTGTGHGAAETPYASRRRMDFFVRHLLGKVPRWE